jgi:hypothetical protein
MDEIGSFTKEVLAYMDKNPGGHCENAVAATIMHY